MTTNYSFKSMLKKYVSSSSILILCSIFALVCATKQTTSLIIKEKTPRDRAFTLFALKVRLND